MNVCLKMETIAYYSKDILNPKAAYRIVTNNYCNKMINHSGYCPQDCRQCKKALDMMFTNLGSANKKEAVLTYRAREAYAIAQEEYSEKEKTKPKEKTFMDLFDKKSKNPFENLLKVIEDAHSEKSDQGN